MSRGYAAIGLCQPKIVENVGGVMRAAHVYGASLIVVSGKRYKPQASDTTKAWRHIPLLHVEDPIEAIPYDCVPVCIEFDETAIPLPSYRHPERAFYVFGPEDGSVPKAIQERCRDVVYVPTQFCMNLAATVNVILYDRSVKAGAWR